MFKNMQIVGFEQISTKFIGIFNLQEKFLFRKKPPVETTSVAINDNSNVLCFDLYLINIFAKSKKVEKSADIMFKLTLYCLSVTFEDLNL